MGILQPCPRSRQAQGRTVLAAEVAGGLLSVVCTSRLEPGVAGWPAVAEEGQKLNRAGNAALNVFSLQRPRQLPSWSDQGGALRTESPRADGSAGGPPLQPQRAPALLSLALN